jgi:hypothetical protein
MVVRYVFAKLKTEHTSDAERRKTAKHSKATLLGIKGVKEVRVGVPADDKSATAWDLSIEIHFDRIEDVEPYRVDPVHKAYLDDYLGPRTEMKKAWNLEIIEDDPE